MKRATEEAGGREMFWFTTMGEADEQRVLADPIGRLAGMEGLQKLV